MRNLAPWCIVAALLLPALATGAETAADFDKVLDLRCTPCHTRERIDAARRQGVDFGSIDKKMSERGARLTERDRRVLGTFWGDPMKKK